MAEPKQKKQSANIPFLSLPNLASEALGTKVLFATDEFFAPVRNMIQDTAAEWREGVYTEFGKWMDGWESGRKRTAGHDWCIIRLGLPGAVRGIHVDTSFFTGNFVPRVSIQACGPIAVPKELLMWRSEMGNAANEAEFELVSQMHSEDWEEILPQTPLKAGYKDTCNHYFPVEDNDTIFHYIRVNIFPDGGIARLRIHGEVMPDRTLLESGQPVDLVAVENGGLAIGWSGYDFGTHPRLLLNPGRGTGMFDGWETARKSFRNPILKPNSSGQIQFDDIDYVVAQLGCPGHIQKCEIDTIHFKGNNPESFVLEACNAPQVKLNKVPLSEEEVKKMPWKVIAKRTKLQSHSRRYVNVDSQEVFTHVRLIIFPDGGVSRLRIWGHPAADQVKRRSAL